MIRRLAVAVPILAAAGLLAAAPGRARAASVPPPLVVVVMENHSLTAVTGDPADMPYLNQLWNDPASEQLTSYFAVSHPSFPNYAALATGSTVATTDDVTAGEFANRTVWDQLTAAGVSWGVFEGAVPATCSPVQYWNDTTSGDPGPYKIGHNPAVPFAGVYGTPECQHVQPPSAMPSVLPQVSFVAPNLCDDMHGVPSTDTHGYKDCVAGTSGLEQRSDGWLASHVPGWFNAGADVLVVFDEGGSSNQVYAVLTGPGVTGGRNSTPMTHYSVLAGIEQAYGLPLLGNAAAASPLVLPGSSPPPSGCPAPPAGQSELSGNVSLETSQAGWTGIRNTESVVTRVQPAGGSFDGAWGLQVSASSGSVAGVNNANPVWVTSSQPGVTYTGSAFVRGAPGLVVSLIVRETTQAGAGGIGYHTTDLTLPDSGWHQVTSAYTAKNAGDLIRWSLYSANLGAGQFFQADCLSEWG